MGLKYSSNFLLKSPEAPRTVIWYRNGARVNTLLKRGGISVVTESRRRTSNLLVSKVTTDDAGNYTCAPSNAQADSVMVHVIKGKILFLCFFQNINSIAYRKDN